LRSLNAHGGDYKFAQAQFQESQTIQAGEEKTQMKRDMDLVRQILLEVEEQPFTGKWLNLEIDGGFTRQEITYHVMILYEAGLLEAVNLTTHGGKNWRPTRLTWEGHEFLEAARDNSRWQKAKSTMMEKAGGITFEILKQLLMKLMMNQILPTP
jgi:hypothetical protein